MPDPVQTQPSLSNVRPKRHDRKPGLELWLTRERRLEARTNEG